MVIVGITGSIGMGKTTAAGFFAEAGIPVNDADATVHALYRGEAAPLIEAVFPGTMKNGEIDRQELSRKLAGNPAKFKELEAIVHPLVRKCEAEFVEAHRWARTEMVVLDMPLLFETGDFERVDVVVVVSCDPDTQRQRVMARPGMTEEKFRMILAKQVPDSEKRARADYVIDTWHELDVTRRRVMEIIAAIRARRKRTE